MKISFLLIFLFLPSIILCDSTPTPTPTPSFYEISIYVPVKKVNNIVNADIPKGIETVILTEYYDFSPDQKGVTITAVIGSNKVKASKTAVANFPSVSLVSVKPVPTPTPTKVN